jgi:hypothetical protein
VLHGLSHTTSEASTLGFAPAGLFPPRPLPL